MGTSKKYRLLKDLPGWEVGDVFKENADGTYTHPMWPNSLKRYEKKLFEDSPDLFEEIKEIPENQAWVVPGTKYRHIGWGINWFIPEKFDFEQNRWTGVFVLDGKSYFSVSFYIHNKNSWMVVREEPKKPKRKAPAYVWIGDDWTTYGLYASEQEAKDDTRSFRKMEWPALHDSDGFYPGPKVEG